MGEPLVAGLSLDGLTEAATSNNQSLSTYKLAFALISVAFMWSLLLEVMKMGRGQTPDFGKPILTLVVFIGLLGFYRVIVHNLIGLITSFGSLSNVDTGRALARRAASWQQAYKLNTSGLEAADSFFALGIHQFEETMYTILTSLSYAATSAVLWAMKIIQRVMTTVLIAFGPFIIALSAFPGPTRRLLAGWFMALIEVTAWGLTARILARQLNSGWSNAATSVQATLDASVQQNPFEHIVYNLLYAFAFLSIPVITSVVIRGSSAAGLGQQAMGGMTAAASAVGGAAGGAIGAAAGGGAARGVAKTVGAAASAIKNAAQSGFGGGGGGGGGGNSGARAGDASTARRQHFSRDGAIKKQEREK